MVGYKSMIVKYLWNYMFLYSLFNCLAIAKRKMIVQYLCNRMFLFNLFNCIALAKRKFWHLLYVMIRRS